MISARAANDIGPGCEVPFSKATVFGLSPLGKRCTKGRGSVAGDDPEERRHSDSYLPVAERS